MMRIVIIAIKSNVISQSPPQRCMLDFMNILSSFANVQNIEILNMALDTLRNTNHRYKMHIFEVVNLSIIKNIKKKFQTKAFNET